MYGRPASTAATVDAWLEALAEPRRTELRMLHEHILAVAPSLAATARVERQFLVYGHYGYNYASGRTGLWFPFGLASNAGNIAVYGPPNLGVETVAERLPKANLGRGCIRIKRVAEADLSAFDDLIRAAADADGKHFTWTKDGGFTTRPLE